MVRSFSAAALVHSACIAFRRKNVFAHPEAQMLRTNSAVSTHFTSHLLQHSSFQPVIVRLAAVSPGA
jgi:hypothetical protein